MLVYVLAIAVALGSFAIYMAAFFYPEVHRQRDFIWSGVGLFYALVLWVCAGQIRGGLLLGQTASVALLGWLGWQTLRLRWEITPVHQRTVPEKGSFVVQLVERAQKAGAMLAGVLSSRPPVASPLSTSTTIDRPTPTPAAAEPETGEPSVTTVAPPSAEEVVVGWDDESVEPEVGDLEVTAIDETTVEDLTAADVDRALADLGPDLDDLESESSVEPAVATVPSRSNQEKVSSDPISTTKEILVSLKEASIQLFRNLTGRKPKRPTIVIERPPKSPISEAPSEAPVAEAEVDLDDLDFEDAETAPGEPPAVSEAVADLVQPDDVETSERESDEFKVDGELLDSERSDEADLAEPVSELEAEPEAADVSDAIDASLVDADAVTAEPEAVEVAELVEVPEVVEPLVDSEPEAEPEALVEEAIAADDDLVATDLKVVELLVDEEESNWDSEPDQTDVILTIEVESAATVPYETEEPELVRPHPPSPELVEAALEDAAEKNISAHPPVVDEAST